MVPDRAHYAGEFFLLFVACAWLAYAPPERAGRVPTTWKTGLPAVLVVVLAAQIVTTLAILPDATLRPFAPDRTLAEVAERGGFARDVVSGQDFSTLKSTFGKGYGQLGYDGRADFNNNDVVNTTDFNLLKNTFGSGGCPPILR